MLSKDKVKELKAKLQLEYDQHLAASNQSLANANATKGAIQACDHLLSLPDETVEPCTVEDCDKAEAA
jgi:hypothetical protein